MNIYNENNQKNNYLKQIMKLKLFVPVSYCIQIEVVMSNDI